MATEKHLHSVFWLIKHFFIKNVCCTITLATGWADVMPSPCFTKERGTKKILARIIYLVSPKPMFFPNHNTKEPIK